MKIVMEGIWDKTKRGKNFNWYVINKVGKVRSAHWKSARNPVDGSSILTIDNP